MAPDADLQTEEVFSDLRKLRSYYLRDVDMSHVVPERRIEVVNYNSPLFVRSAAPWDLETFIAENVFGAAFGGFLLALLIFIPPIDSQGTKYGPH